MQKEIEVTRTLELEHLKFLADTHGPCLTICLPIEKSPNTARLEDKRLKSVVRAAEQALEARGVPVNTIRELLDPIVSVADIRERWGTAIGGTLVVFRSEEVFRAFEVHQKFNEAVHAANHFQIRPILKSLQQDQVEFYLLALSQKHVRLLRCTHYDSVEIPLPAGVPANIEEWLNTRSADSLASGSTGGSFTSTTDIDKKDEQLANFFHAINKGLTEMLKDQSLPLVLCAVEYELTMYRTINTYGSLVEEGVQGSPQSLKGGEMHKRALEIAREHTKEPMRKALTIYEKLGGTDRVSAKPVEILKAAHQARIAYLFIGEGATYEGRFDQSAMKVHNDGITEDLLNLAALRTIANGGEVWVTVPGRIPEQAPMAAIFRY
jgi:hypothetical protein